MASPGMEGVDGTQASKLYVVGRQANIRHDVSKLTISVDLARNISLKQVMMQPDGEFTGALTYSNIRYNTRFRAACLI